MARINLNVTLEIAEAIPGGTTPTAVLAALGRMPTMVLAEVHDAVRPADQPHITLRGSSILNLDPDATADTESTEAYYQHGDAITVTTATGTLLARGTITHLTEPDRGTPGTITITPQADQ